MKAIIPVGYGLVSNSDVARHQVKEGFSPGAVNMLMTPGVAMKRWGYHVIHSFDAGDIIRSAFVYDKDHVILHVFDYSANDSKLWEWDGNAVSPTLTLLASGIDATAVIHFCRHFDSNAVGDGTDNKGVVICAGDTAGVYAYDPNAAAGAKMATVSADPVGYFCASMNGILMLADMFDGAVNARYKIGISESDDCSSWAYTAGLSYDFENRPENGSEIMGLAVQNNALIYVMKKKGIWPIQTPLQFGAPVFTDGGLSSEFGYIITDSNLYFNNNSKIVDLANNHISYPVHNIIAGWGSPDSITAGFDQYQNRQYWSVANNLLLFDMVKNNWSHWQYPYDIRILSNMEPPVLTESWVGRVEKHNYLTTDEETMMSDMLLAVNDRVLAIQNHFSEDGSTNSSDGVAVSCSYETPWFAAESQYTKKRWINIDIQGKPLREVRVYYAAVDYPQREAPTWSLTPVSVTLDAYGYGRANIDALGAWLSVRVEEQSINPFYLNSIQPEFIVRESLK